MNHQKKELGPIDHNGHACRMYFVTGQRVYLQLYFIYRDESFLYNLDTLRMLSLSSMTSEMRDSFRTILDIYERELEAYINGSDL